MSVYNYICMELRRQYIKRTMAVQHVLYQSSGWVVKVFEIHLNTSESYGAT